MNDIALQIKEWGQALGFQQVGITNVDLSSYENNFLQWLDKKFHGEMHYMTKHGTKRLRPFELLENTCRVISVRMDYLPQDTAAIAVLQDASKGYVSRYALGRDYHKLMRKRLQALVTKIQKELTESGFSYRVFTDSAPVLEKPLAEKAGLGWIGKSTNLINRHAGSWFFLGEIFIDLPLPIDAPVSAHCGSCTACIDVCPTQAIVGPYQLDARRCISYLTIELKGSIPEDLRGLMGNRIYGCDDCQLCCPWNRYAKFTGEKDFHPRHGLEASQLVDLFLWTEEDFIEKTKGSAISRIGHERWLRNIAVALGNAPRDDRILAVLKTRMEHPSPLVREHVSWALAQQNNKK